ncbi:glycosyl hydrolase [Spirochaetia bacterium]|nr:glycosyl hydrolase [Spirochaetia bacterium]
MPEIELLLKIYFIVMITISVYFYLMSTINILSMRAQTQAPSLTNGPLISVLVPARNEEKNIERCLLSLRNQTYKNYEILVIDDNSTDETWNILQRIEKEDTRVHVFKGDPLPSDWYGKPFALHQLMKKAKGEYILFTDADTVHGPTSVSWVATNFETSRADFISGYVGQELRTIGEITTVPIMFFLTGFVIPMFLNHIIKLGYFSAAVGQFIAIKHDVYDKTGGFDSFKDKTTEDVYMSRNVKSQGYVTEFLDITNQVRCRMYEGYSAGIQGIGKNIFDFVGKNHFIIFIIAIAVLLFFILPFPLLFILAAVDSPYLLQCGIVNILATITWLTLFIGRRINFWGAFLWPVLYVNLLFMSLWSWFRTVSGKGFVWKGRVVS